MHCRMFMVSIPYSVTMVAILYTNCHGNYDLYTQWIQLSGSIYAINLLTSCLFTDNGIWID